MKKTVLLITAVMMIWFLLPLFSHGVLNIGNISGIALCTAVILSIIKGQSIPHWIQAVIKTAAVLSVILAVGGTIGMVYASRIKPVGNETMIILGGSTNGRKPSRMLADRLNAAAVYLAKHPEMTVIVSGGQGNDEDISEADAMDAWLKKHGVSNRIYREDQSTSTDENIHFSKELIQKEKLNDSVLIVTDGFHEYRAYLLCLKYELNFHALPVKTDFFLFPAFYARELLAIFRQWIIRLFHL